MKKLIAYMLVVAIWVWIILACLPVAHALSTQQTKEAKEWGELIAQEACADGRVDKMHTTLTYTTIEKRKQYNLTQNKTNWNEFEYSHYMLEGFESYFTTRDPDACGK
jgi:hypothetical protein